jgi:L-lactate dehydrogenase complex protein LldG
MANDAREKVTHPGLLAAALEPPLAFRASERIVPVDAFEDRFTAAGGEVVRLAKTEAAAAWLADFTRGFTGVAVSEGVPEPLAPTLPRVPSDRAPLGVSMAVAAAAQTGSLLLSSVGGRRPQLLPPVTIIWIWAGLVYPTLGQALVGSRESLPAALALHSGPSKSADIGRVLVRGVHGPGRIVAVVLGAGPELGARPELAARL